MRETSTRRSIVRLISSSLRNRRLTSPLCSGERSRRSSRFLRSGACHCPPRLRRSLLTPPSPLQNNGFVCVARLYLLHKLTSLLLPASPSRRRPLSSTPETVSQLEEQATASTRFGLTPTTRSRYTWLARRRGGERSKVKSRCWSRYRQSSPRLSPLLNNTPPAVPRLPRLAPQHLGRLVRVPLDRRGQH